jgi:hypothetical protein
VRQLQSYSALPANGEEQALSPLAKKLRLKSGYTFAVLNSPPGYLSLLEPGPGGIVTEVKPGVTYDAVQLFVNNAAELRALGGTAVRAVKPDGLLWITYPKAGRSDLPATPWWNRRDVLGEVSGETGFKPVAFVKIDETWTALRFKRT